MSSDGKKILLSIIAVPILASIGAFILFQRDAESIGDTLVYVFGTNLIPMLIGGLFSGILIRFVSRANGTAANKRWIALAPITLTFLAGMLWYLLALVNLGSFDSGREFFSGPIYLLILAGVTGVFASIAYAVVPKASS
jgi:hypothetical protein